MAEEGELALWLTAAALKADGREVAALAVGDLQADVAAGRDLSGAIEDMRRFDRRPGDFGAEIVGPLLIPILVEAGKQLWAAYLKRMTEEAGKQLADLTLEGLKRLARSAWSKEPELPARYAQLIRGEAERQGLPPDQVERLVAAVAGPQMVAELEAA